MSDVMEMGQATFDEVLAAGRPVVVDFWAPWCGPCRVLSPLVEEVAAEQRGSITVGKVNVDEHPGLASRYGVMSIPSVIRFDGGRETHRVVGAVSKPELVRRLGL
ncbi:MAG: thioredoxin [Thermaerobacter sp.]|nr:thioredoxin [Thermaerobacter sp.]